ncbi:hypothetical protein N0V90_013386 [Kalmusia sp. IMI 367209]|nr:hypothetical protein N0V90_013386 [Kalmusia sp. IMI 367209]
MKSHFPEPSPSSSPIYHDSLENPDTLIPFTPSSQPDLCAALGSSLENLRHTDPALYESYVSSAPSQRLYTSTGTSEQKPISTTVLLRLAAHNKFQNLGVVLPSAPEERKDRIECRVEERQEGEERWGAYQVSWITLIVLQITVAVVVVACVAEGVMLGVQWMSKRDPSTLVATSRRPALRVACETVPIRPALRLGGEERRLLAIPAIEDMRSPGIEKKMRVYASPSWKAARYAYIEDEDDEFNRPVM